MIKIKKAVALVFKQKNKSAFRMLITNKQIYVVQKMDNRGLSLNIIQLSSFTVVQVCDFNITKSYILHYSFAKLAIQHLIH